MAREIINTGSAANSGDGEALRSCFTKINNMTLELYNDDAGDVNSITATAPIVRDSPDGNVTISLADDGITYAKLGTEFTTSAAVSALAVDFATAQVFTKTLSGDTTLTFSNDAIGMVKDLVITGDFTLTLPSGSTVAGEYDGTVSNLIQVVVTGASTYWYSISQPI